MFIHGVGYFSAILLSAAVNALLRHWIICIRQVALMVAPAAAAAVLYQKQSLSPSCALSLSCARPVADG